MKSRGHAVPAPDRAWRPRRFRQSLAMSGGQTELLDPAPERLLSTENRMDGRFSRQASL